MKMLAGVLPAVVTPLSDQGRFRPDVFRRLLKRLYSTGVDGVYVCGSTGEGLVLPVDERKRVAEAARAHSPPEKRVVVHIGATRTDEALELARHASQIGVDAISSLPPMGGYTFLEVRAYYERLAETTDLPLLLYYMPNIAPAIQSIEQILELCALPNIVGLKFTDLNLYTLSTLKEHGLTVLNGKDEVLGAGLLMGADGGIGTFYNVMPELFVALYSHALDGHWEEVRSAQRQINHVIRHVQQFPIFPAIKEILAWSGLASGHCLPPRQRLSPTEAEALRIGLEMVGTHKNAHPFQFLGDGRGR